MIAVVATVAVAIVVVMSAAPIVVVLIVAPVPPPESPAVFTHQSSSFDSRIKRRRLTSLTGTID